MMSKYLTCLLKGILLSFLTHEIEAEQFCATPTLFAVTMTLFPSQNHWFNSS